MLLRKNSASRHQSTRSKVHKDARLNRWSIRTQTAISFSVLSIVGMLILGMVLYSVFNNRMIEKEETASVQMLEQTGISMRDYLRSMMQIEQTMYYSVIEQTDLEKETFSDEMALLYSENKDYLTSMACFYKDGTLIAAEPYTTMKPGVAVSTQDWFVNADAVNPTFSTPHIQNLFDTSNYKYHRVVSLSQEVELTNGGDVSLGVLVIDMSYLGIEEIFDSLNDNASVGYSYLVSGDGSGTVIYHPDINLIDAGLYSEDTIKAEKLSDGAHRENYGDSKYIVIVKTVSYTGWKIIRVIPIREISLGLQNTRYFIALLLTIIMLIVTILTIIISRQLTRPLGKLTRSIEALDGENMDGEIYVGGCSEVEYLGSTLRFFVDKIRNLMADIVKEQEEKRKHELDALQSQINPHFLYNTLDSIVWMIEAEQNKDAIFMIRQLASLFRISLSKGKTMISISDELMHAQNYMNIQAIRYRNKFEIEYDIDPEILTGTTVKLILQPILENALYYAVEVLDGEGEITVIGEKVGEDIYIKVIDNGMGMPAEIRDKLLVEGAHTPKRGSGVGLINVHKRIQIRFGQQYGLRIESEPDEGTTVIIHLPYIEYTGGKKNA